MSENAQPVFSIEKLYVKDLSVEVPGAPQIFLERETPQVNVQLRTEGQVVEEGVYEVTLTVTVNARIGEDRNLFLVEVAVETATGKTTVEKMITVGDIGKVNNYSVVDGQIHGGVAQGIGLALSEDYEDLKKHATIRGAGIPYAKDIPDDMEIIYVETPRPPGPHGAWGVGEMPLTAPHAAVLNAVYNACGARVRELPALPEKILAAMKK